MVILEATRLGKIYGGKAGKPATQALQNVSFSLKKGEFVGIMGPSGSGKTTLLNLISTIDRPTTGEVIINNQNISALKGEKLAGFRRKELGFIFQDFNLLDTLTIEENIALPLVIGKVSHKVLIKKVFEVAKALGISEVLTKYPYEVSGGEQQRAAAARAIVHDPALILADEPTGNLDSKSSKDLMEALKGLNLNQSTILMVTHDPFVASYCQRILFIRDGKLYTQIQSGDNRQAFFQQILDVLSMLGGSVSELTKNRL